MAHGMDSNGDVADALVAAARDLSAAVARMRFGAPVACVYNPLSYAWAAHEQYLRRYGNGRKRIVLVGMNPGPFGMAQTGVPFGEVTVVTTWMKIDAPIHKPRREHPARPVLGYACTRSEVSGGRLWGAVSLKFKDPARFFRDHFVLNYCPLLFLEDSGRNRTPDKLPPKERARLEAACDAHLARALAALSPAVVLGVGAYAKKRVERVRGDATFRVGMLPHPSPASPAANRGWDRLARDALVEQGIEPFL